MSKLVRRSEFCENEIYPPVETGSTDNQSHPGLRQVRSYFFVATILLPGELQPTAAHTSYRSNSGKDVSDTLMYSMMLDQAVLRSNALGSGYAVTDLTDDHGSVTRQIARYETLVG